MGFWSKVKGVFGRVGNALKNVGKGALKILGTVAAKAGAPIGAVVGSLVPGVGTAAGGALGGLIQGGANMLMNKLNDGG